MTRPLSIYLTDLVHDWLPGNYVVPLNIGLVASSLRHSYGKDVEIRLFKSPARLLASLEQGPAPDIYGFSNYSWNQELNRHFLALVRQLAPNATICSGGPHIRTEEAGIAAHLAAHPELDFYCLYDGEPTMVDIVGERLTRSTPLRASNCGRAITGAAFLSEGKLLHESREFRKETIENLPSPYLDGTLDEFVSAPDWIPLFETNRGCPYACTYCVWGISALNKVRVFPIERIAEEIRFVSARSPATRWIFADANFGMLARDIDIAREIRAASDRDRRVRTVNLWWAKNSSRHVNEIVDILGDLSDPGVAVQSMDQDVLKNVRRGNIKLSAMFEVLDEFHSKGVDTYTDLLVGLPGETQSSHLDTLRKVFDAGFDYFNISNLRLLPGSEMESDESRATHGLKPKFRLIAGSYGEYGGTPIVEYEEAILETNAISFDEMLFLRLVHFLMWPLWNLGMARPLMRWMHREEGINPLDVILTLTKGGHDADLDAFLAEFIAEARGEWFETSEDLINHHTSHFEDLRRDGFTKLNMKFMAKLLLNPALTGRMLDLVADMSKQPLAKELARFCFERTYFFAGDRPPAKRMVFSPELTGVLPSLFAKPDFAGTTCDFTIEERLAQAIDFELKRFNFDENPLRGLTLALEAYSYHMTYDFTFTAARE